MKLAVVAVMLVSGLAAAKPLPPAWKVTLEAPPPSEEPFPQKQIVARRDGVAVPVFGTDTVRLVSADLSDDGKTLRIVRETCMGGLDDAPEEVPLAKLDANVENALGMTVHVKKRYAEAIKRFAVAVAEDPGTPVYATNLLSAQAMSGMLDDADKLLAVIAKQNAPWLAWRLAVDPELKGLVGRPAAKLVAKPGAGKSKSGTVLYSPLGIAAVEIRTSLSDEVRPLKPSHLMAFIDVATGKVLMTLPTDGSRKVVDRVLAALGAETVKGGYRSLLGAGRIDDLTIADGTKVLLAKDLTVVANGKSRVLTTTGRLYAIALVPKAVLIIHAGDKHFDTCQADPPYDEVVQVEATP